MGPVADRLQIRRGGAAAAAVADTRLMPADAILYPAIDIRVEGDADFLGCGQHRLVDGGLLANVGNPQGAIATMQRAGATAVGFAFDEIGQHVVIGPAVTAGLCPAVEVFYLPPDIDHAVDRTGAAQHLAARQEVFLAVAIFFRLRFEAPVDVGVNDIPAIAKRDMNPEIFVFGACLQQQYAVGRVGAQPVGENAAR